MSTFPLGGKVTFPNSPLTVHRLGYGAMQLAGKGVFGPPKDRAAAVAVLQAAIKAGVDHIDTSDFYGPHITNQIIREALHPYPENLVIVTKVGVKRPADGSWQPAFSREDLIAAVHDNLKNLGVETLDIVNYRSIGEKPMDRPIERQLTVLAELQREGLIRHIGLSNVTHGQVLAAQKIIAVACVQNFYNIAQRGDDPLVDALAEMNIPYVPFFPLGGFTPVQSETLSKVAAGLHATPMQVALAWLLHRSPNILLIPGTSSVEHLAENLAAAKLELSDDILAELDQIGAAGAST